MEYLLVLVGFVLLVKGADWFVDSASNIAHVLKIPSIVIGLTIVAFGTSAPEAAVSITAAINGNNDIALGNVIGSNIFNLLVVVGLSAIILVLPVKQSLIKKEIPYSILGAVLLLLFISDKSLGRIEGFILLVFFAYFLFYTIKDALLARNQLTEEKQDNKNYSMPKSVIGVFIGIFAIIIGGQAVVKGASEIARNFGVTETLIGLTIVAIGTSLPELVTSIVAARKGENDIAIGNVIGSNIFNILFILGISAVIHPIQGSMESIIDTIILTVVSLLFYFGILKPKKVGRGVGIIMIVAYIAFTAYIIIR